jgi:hypothetical protein
MSQPHAFPDNDVPQFSAGLEADIRVGLRMRLGREPTRDELGDYRKALWALACAVQFPIIRTALVERTTLIEQFTAAAQNGPGTALIGPPGSAHRAAGQRQVVAPHGSG